MKIRILSIVALLAASVVGLAGQEAEDRSVVNWADLKAIVNEASGERALHNVSEIVPFSMVRPHSEYEGTFRESVVLSQLAREAGFQNVQIEQFPATPTWFVTQADLWMVQPETQKLYDANSVHISIAGNSESGDITADLVDVGVGARAENYAGKDVTGKIVLGSASAGVLQRLAVFERGAAGVLSYNSLRPDSYPDNVLYATISANPPPGKPVGFAWEISPRVGRDLATRLSNGQPVKIRSVVKSGTAPGRLEMVSGMIPGDHSSNQAIVLSGHLFEGYQKQGANDDGSGCGLILEMGRAYMQLVAEGKLPKPKRDIYFTWIPEISGTNAWLNKHPDIQSRLIGDINFDQTGLALRRSLSFWTLFRTPDSVPTFIDDLAQSILDVVSDTNVERVRFRHNGYHFTYPIVAPTGTQDPFYTRTSKYISGIDLSVYVSRGIPGVSFTDWPDVWYHSSHDTVEQGILDATQFKRAAVVGIATMSVLASADETTAVRVAGESVARGTERLGEAQRKGIGYLSDAKDGTSLTAAYRDAQVTLSHQAEFEKAVLQSAAVLFPNPADGKRKLVGLNAPIEAGVTTLQGELKAFYQLQAGMRNVQPTEPVLSDIERQASHLVASGVPQPGGATFRLYTRTGSFGSTAFTPAAIPSNVSSSDRASIEAAVDKLEGHLTDELRLLLARNMTVLQIRDFLSGEYSPVPVADLLDYLRALEKLGQVKITEQAGSSTR